ncbi:MAG: histidine kinase [Ignavibacteriae bacterium HGW-Ignavibacteriae-3]|nr:MAG: histidine kinase [Ignavibacteriae bacterium HGW-Ignavibacteriae-3]
MKRFLIIFLLITSVSVFPQQKVKVTLEVIAPALDDSAGIYVTGNLKELGEWRPDRVMLDRKEKGLWVKSIEVLKGTRLEYKFTKGSWENEALGSDSSVPQNSVLIANNDTTVQKIILNWRDKFNFKVKGQITGTVVHHKNFVLEGLKPRDIFVWLPPDYMTNSKKHYPVFYMHDGQNLVDPKTSNTFIDWQVDETADSLIRNGIIEPFIIVGINNTADRSVEYGNTKLGRLYIKLIVERIKPFIDKEYRTLPEAKHTAVGGSSMGGLISMMCAWERPDVFSKAACFSPAFNIADIDYIKNVLEYSGTKKNITIYIDNGGVDLDARLMPGVREMVNALEKKGFVKDKDLFVVYDMAATHNEAAWAKRAGLPIKIFFGE